jgi:CRP/FNR family transcriptional regulator
VDRAALLLQAPVFGELPPDAVRGLVPRVIERSFSRGQVVWFEGDPSDGLGILVEGTLKSYRTSPNGAEVILGFNTAVDLYGEPGAFHPSGLRQVNVTAMTEARCFTVPREPLVDFLCQHPTAMIRLLERVSSVTVQAATSFSDLAFGDVRSRVASALLALAGEYGHPVGGGVEIRLRMSQATLASLVAASRENVNRALSGFLAAGVVAQEDGYFLVLDEAALRDVVGGRHL